MSEHVEFVAPAGHVIRFIVSSSGSLAVTVKYPDEQGVVGFTLPVEDVERVRDLLVGDRGEDVLDLVKREVAP